MKPGGQWHRWWWWHVPPFWHRSMALSHTRAAENKAKRTAKTGGEINGLPAENINRPVHRAQAASSCPVCINLCLKVQRTHQGGRSQGLSQGSDFIQDDHSAKESPQTNTNEQRRWTGNCMDLWIFLAATKGVGKSWQNKRANKRWQR